MSRQKASQDEAVPVQPKMKIRSQQVQFHHLFKATVASMKKNLTPWMKGSPSFKDVEHVHFFHSIDSFGNEQTHTSEVGGHFHEVSWHNDGEGMYIAKCGPALKKITKRGRDGYPKTSIVPVKFMQIPNDETEKSEIVDDHIHVMHYEGSDEISVSKVQEIQNRNSQKIAAMTPPKKVIPDMPDIKESDRE